ncbi:hypothetical protein BG261_06570 [Floricoccus tropicus]|uniref:6-methylsalicylate decarboxylase n=1 Tax=Floricoccus tropicus TaxID=1859473 RepID=A0A1E8GKS7_9LACT|nr:amidohydrolase family protein [Floricoccus tropicus]OFI48556.1 hypothetical protein BG261_06570 [Floricoccus tropicus]
MLAKVKKIDFHTHFIPKAYKNFLKDNFNDLADGVKTPEWTVEDHLNLMEEENITHSIISLSSPHPSHATKNECLKLISEINKEGLNLVKNHSNDFSYVASLPLPYINESLTTIDNLKNEVIGFSFPTNSKGQYLGNEKLNPVMQKLNDIKSLAFIHPTEPYEQNIEAGKNIKTPLMEFFFDTTRTLANMAESNIFTKYPNIIWIIPHAGALIPIIAQRISEGNKFLSKNEIYSPDNLLQIMNNQNIYFDLAGMVLPYQLPTLLQITSSDHFLYGSDFPYTPIHVIDGLAQQLEETKLITEIEKQDIFYKNAEKLLGGKF